MATLTIYLDARRVSQSGEAPIQAVVHNNRTSAFIPLGIRIEPSQWDSKAKKVKASHPAAARLNRAILSQRLAIESAIIKLTDEGRIRALNASQLKEEIQVIIDPEKARQREEGNLFLARFERFISLKSRKNTINGYNWTLGKLWEYDPMLGTRSFEDITSDYIKDFQVWCQSSINRNSTIVHMRYIKAVFNDAIDAGITNAYPFRHISLKPLPVKKKALNPAQLKTLLNFPCEKSQQEYRDMFILMFLLRGINIGDMLQATDAQLVDGRFEYRRNKVGSLFSIKVEPEAMDIIRRYKGTHHLLSPMDRYKDHMDYLHHLNHALKNIGRSVGRHGKSNADGLFPGLSSNWARHTWATLGAWLDIPQDIISRGMGHSPGIAVTNIYIDYDNKKVDDANRKMIDFIYYGKDYRNPAIAPESSR